jgi:hypothetical protein
MLQRFPNGHSNFFVLCSESFSLAVTVGAKQFKITQSMILPVSVNMMQLKISFSKNFSFKSCVSTSSTTGACPDYSGQTDKKRREILTPFI